MKKIKNKSSVILKIEKKRGKNIEEILRRLYVDENMNIHDITKELRVSYVTIFRWLRRAGVYSRKLGIDD